VDVLPFAANRDLLRDVLLHRTSNFINADYLG